MRKEEKTEVKVRQVPILMEDGRRIVPKVFKNGDSSAPNLSADFQKDIEDFVGKSGERREKSNGFTKRIFFQSTEEIEEVTSRTRQGLTRPRGEESVDGEGKAETREKQSRRSLPPEAGVLFDSDRQICLPFELRLNLLWFLRCRCGITFYLQFGPLGFI